MRLDAPLPRELVVGAGTAVFVCGSCFAPDATVRSLRLVVDGERQAVMAHGMPRLDLFATLHPGLDPFDTAGLDADPRSSDDPHLHGYRSGFWGLAVIGPRDHDGVCELRLEAELEAGPVVDAPLASIPLRRELAPPAPVASTGAAHQPLVAICMATHNPPLDLLRRQLASIRGQTHERWVCLISDDNSAPEHLAALTAAVADDPRFVVAPSSRQLGFYGNFERALAMAPADADYVALADQDDEWHPDKLTTLVQAIGEAQLVYSDARIVARDGQVISDTYWNERDNNHSDLLSLLVANAVTGAASLLRRDLLDAALPFPPAQFAHYHDHWIGLVALSLGDIAFVERALYDYVQHGRASLGHAAANRMIPLRERVHSLRRDPRERVRMWRLHYFVDVCRLMQFATVLRLRCGPRMTPAKRRTLDRFLHTDDSLRSLARLGLRGARELTGRPQTLGAEWMLFHAFAWRRLLAATTRERPVRRWRIDALPPPNLAPKPGRVEVEGAAARTIIEKIAPLALAVSDDAPERVNLLIPTVDLEHFFGGYIAKFNLARRLAQRGARVRIVTVDPVGALPPSWTTMIESYSGLEGLFDHVEIAFGRESTGLEVSRRDRFIATTWWTAHLAHAALAALEGERFLYLIQEYEPFTFPMGSFAALAAESYGFPHDALFSTELLRDYFRRHAIGVYANGRREGNAASASFQNAITAIDPPLPGELQGRTTRSLLFYARPEAHAARNMFELGVVALSRAIESGCFQDGWQLHGIGTLRSGRRLALGGDAVLELLPRAAQDDYARQLRRHDVGLALMYTPHPSLVPIEMASAGMLTVTNSFENKTPEAMSAISSNLITGEPTLDGIVAGLREAEAGVVDHERRRLGATVRWSHDWDRSFDDELLARVAAWLRL